jgi:hypothetical protein
MCFSSRAACFNRWKLILCAYTFWCVGLVHQV